MEERGYSILRSLGNGASSEVFLVEGRIESKQYVLKRVPADEPEFMQELSILRSIPTHPCIATLKETFLTEGQNRSIANLVLEYCDTGDLYHHLQTLRQEGRKVSEIAGLDWGVEILFGLNFLHANKVVYRDLKSLNVFLVRAKKSGGFYADGSRKYIVKLGDFGVSKKLQNKKEFLSTQIGTPFNMAPEIYLSQPYSFKTDIWALGCVLFEIFHDGQSPFEADSFLGVRKKVLYDRPAFFEDQLDMETRKLIHALLNKDPAKRPSTVDIFKFPCIQARVLHVLELYGSRDREAQSALVRQLCDQGLKDLVSPHLYASAYGSILRRAVEKLKKIQELRFNSF